MDAKLYKNGKKINEHNYISFVWSLCEDIGLSSPRLDIDGKCMEVIKCYKDCVSKHYYHTEIKYNILMAFSYGPVLDLSRCYFNNLNKVKEKEKCCCFFPN